MTDDSSAQAGYDATADTEATGEQAAGDEAARAGRAAGDDPRVADVMERDVVTIGPEATVHELVLLLRQKTWAACRWSTPSGACWASSPRATS